MSTNYYLVRKNNRKNRDLLNKALDKQDTKTAFEIVREMHDGMHIGKQSGGWKFSIPFHYKRGDAPYEANKESYLSYLHKMVGTEDSDYEIRNEYWAVIDYDDYVKHFIEDSHGEDIDSYYKKYPEIAKSEKKIFGDKQSEIIRDNLRFILYEFS